MPMPKPKKDESKKDFLERCMGDSVMNADYPDNKQRFAICNTQWENKESKNMQPEIERRNIELSEFKIVEEEGKPRIRGYAALFDVLSEPMWGFREKIARGAFTKSIKKDDIRALFNHDPNYVLGRNKAKTLTLKEDANGLAIEIDPPDTQWARDLQLSIKRGDISQMSFGFMAPDGGYEWKKGKEAVRIIIEARLFDISPVTYPVYPQTTVAVRDYLSSLNKLDEKGAFLMPELSLAKMRLKFGYRK